MEPALAIFAPLLGKCFAATLAPDLVDLHCFSDVYRGAHVRDAHVVKSGNEAVYSGETIYSMGPSGAEFTYVNSDGGVGHGTVSIAAPTLSISGSMSASASARPQLIVSKWTIGVDGYDVATAGQPTRRFTLSRNKP